MKGEYVEVRKNHSNNITPSNIYMFGKLHQTQNFNHHHHQLPSQPIVSMSAPPPPPSSSSANDGATIEVVRRPRGRPPGSKNKPKPAPNYITTTRDDHMEKSTMSPYILEIPLGVDIIDSVYRFCRKHNTGLCIINGSGTVTNVTLRQPFTNNPDSTITFHGNFNILSISATIIPQSIFSKVLNGFSISLAGPQGQVVGGPVIRPLLSAGPVYLIAASFNNSFYHKFSVEDDEGSQSAVAGDGDSGHTLESTHHEYCY
ncbi:AT-hook motif nuclear-localized protein 28 [Capsicum annuum]|uniref:AT-hook motif nuclear-localized protein 28 n=1 Tax=Capsicum annuum TaxID=4072 RepID=A5GZD1_CAPAN|nr:AT-hook motif nuclear-localized protein 28-like [Capsicum annuum]ABF01666.1 AT-hook1 protein [Capsicum annuum]PHT66347.1 AT-hook motif nuclear-localized protein 28 [Capsicum annuum]